MCVSCVYWMGRKCTETNRVYYEMRVLRRDERTHGLYTDGCVIYFTIYIRKKNLITLVLVAIYIFSFNSSARTPTTQQITQQCKRVTRTAIYTFASRMNLLCMYLYYYYNRCESSNVARHWHDHSHRVFCVLFARVLFFRLLSTNICMASSRDIRRRQNENIHIERLRAVAARCGSDSVARTQRKRIYSTLTQQNRTANVVHTDIDVYFAFGCSEKNPPPPISISEAIV